MRPSALTSKGMVVSWEGISGKIVHTCVRKTLHLLNIYIIFLKIRLLGF